MKKEPKLLLFPSSLKGSEAEHLFNAVGEQASPTQTQTHTASKDQGVRRPHPLAETGAEPRVSLRCTLTTLPMCRLRFVKTE